MNNNQFDPELLENIFSNLYDDLIIEKKRLTTLDENYIKANNIIPESFCPVDMLYFDCFINNVPIQIFVDTGAQTSIMSLSCAKRCKIDHLIDERYNGVAVGVGQSKILGKIWLVDIEIMNMKDNKLDINSLPCSFTILEIYIDIIFGLDMLNSHGCLINLKNKSLNFGDHSIKFVNKIEH